MNFGVVSLTLLGALHSNPIEQKYSLQLHEIYNFCNKHIKSGKTFLQDEVCVLWGGGPTAGGS